MILSENLSVLKFLKKIAVFQKMPFMFDGYRRGSSFNLVNAILTEMVDSLHLFLKKI